MARLVAATCPHCGAGIQLDPDVETVTCTFCGVSSFDEPELVHQALVEELGEGYRVQTLALYPEYAIITVAPTPGEAILDRYTLRRGMLGDKDPQRVSARDKSTLEATLIAPEAIEFNKTVHMRADAVAALDIAGAAVSYLVLSFSTSEPEGPRWGVYVSSERESGFCEYSLQGARLRCHQ